MSSCCSSDVAYRPQRPQGLLGTGAQLESHATAFFMLLGLSPFTYQVGADHLLERRQGYVQKGDDAVYGQHVEVRRLGFPGITFAE